MKAKVDVAIACSGFQTATWWIPLIDSIRHALKSDIDVANVIAMSSAVPDHNKNHAISQSPFASVEEKKRNDLTDANRVVIAQRFLEKGSDYLFFLDDDTVHKPETLAHLLSLAKDFVGGVYFNAKAPYNPIAYIRRPDGLYHALYGYAPGSLIQVDSIGMGCTLIHRSVFERIQAGHVVFQRPTGSLLPVPKDRVRNDNFIEGEQEPWVSDGIYHLPIKKIEGLYPDDDRPWPFFGMEYGRTEDHYFCELAANVGIRPWLDTSITCQHFKSLGVDESHYETELRNKKHDIVERQEDVHAHP